MEKTPCGHKTRNLNGVCDDCRRKIALINTIRSMFGKWSPPKKQRKSKAKEKLVDYYASSKCAQSDTICWHCEKACGGCSWADRFEPVEGWVARKGNISYNVRKCPEYEPLKLKRIEYVKEN